MGFLRSCIAGACVGLFALGLFGCAGGTGNSANAPGGQVANSRAAAPKTNVEELGMMIRIPYDAEDVVWKENAAQKSLLAVIRFSPEDSQKLIAASGSGEANTIHPEVWFPDELIAQSEMTGDNALKGTAYSAAAFLQEPYNTGRLTRIDATDYFVLEASRK